MEDYRINLIKISDLDTDEKPIKAITSKPYGAIITCGVVGLLLIVIYPKLWLLGILLLGTALLVEWKIPNQKQIEFYQDYIVIYTRDDLENCQKVRYDEIKEWTVRQGKQSGDNFIMKLDEDKYVFSDCFNASKIVKMMNTKLPDLEANKLKMKNMKNTPFKWPWK